VLVVERRILARLRNQTFFSIGESNATVAGLVERLNTRGFKKIEGNRRSRFEQFEWATLKPLPPRAYEFGEWRKAKVHPDYHIEVARAYYSVPYRLIGERVDVRLTARAVEIFHAGHLVGTHRRSSRAGPAPHPSRAPPRQAHRRQRPASRSGSRARVSHRPSHLRCRASSSRRPQTPRGDLAQRDGDIAPRYPGGTLVTVDAPGAGAGGGDLGTFTGFLQAVNDLGQMTGEFADPNNGYHGYVRNAAGRFVEFTVPGGGTDNANGTYPFSVNIWGLVTGFSADPNGNPTGFVRFANGTLDSFQAPGQGNLATFAYIGNALNQFVGLFIDSNGTGHGFVATAVQ